MFENRYSLLDRTVHRVAFHSRLAQIALGDMEDRRYAKQLEKCQAKRPVFVTALPRAGTTLLLECLAQHPEFAAHTYRDMPFVLVPLMWNRQSSRHQQKAESHERSHGDGMEVSVDSPEALEEVVWKAFWKKHYLRDRIQPWGKKRNADFSEFFRNHMRKIIFLRRGAEAENVRYISKNNANVARLGLLKKMFPECRIVLPFRDPLQHANSLLRQHLNFLKMQQEDPFVLEYMTAIGHFDFGKRLRPIDFDGWVDTAQYSDPTQLGFWLEYWNATYRHVLAQDAERLCLVSYEGLCADFAGVMGRLAESLDIPNPEKLLAMAPEIHPPAAREPDSAGIAPELLAEAKALHAACVERTQAA